MSLKTIFPFDNEDNYSFDDTKIGVTGGLSKLLATVVFGTAYMYVTMDDNVDDDVFRDISGNSRDGALKGGLTGENNKVPAKINNGLQGININQGFVAFGKADFEFDTDEAFSQECWLKTTSNAIMNLMSKQNDSTFQGYALICNVGKARVVVRDQLGNVIAREFNTSINDGNFHHVVMTYDGSGVVAGLQLYVDNAQNDTITSSDILSGSIIASNVDYQISGRDGNNNCIDSDTIIDECVVYDRELTVADISYRWNGGAGTQALPGGSTSFPTDNPYITPRSSLSTTEAVSFLANINASGSDEVRFIMVKTGVLKYWNGAAWVDSDGTFAQSNTATEVNTNISSLVVPSETNITISWRALLHSDDGSTTPELLQVDLEYDIATLPPVGIELCTVWAENLDSEDNPDTSPVEIQLYTDAVKYKNETVVRDDKIIVTPDSGTGIWEVDLIENENMSPGAYYNFEFNGKKYRKIVPNEIRKNFWDLADA